MKVHVLAFNEAHGDAVSAALEEAMRGRWRPTPQLLRQVSERLSREGVPHLVLLGLNVSPRGPTREEVNEAVLHALDAYLAFRGDVASKLGLALDPHAKVNFIWWPAADEERDPPEEERPTQLPPEWVERVPAWMRHRYLRVAGLQPMPAVPAMVPRPTGVPGVEYYRMLPAWPYMLTATGEKVTSIRGEQVGELEVASRWVTVTIDGRPQQVLLVVVRRRVRGTGRTPTGLPRGIEVTVEYPELIPLKVIEDYRRYMQLAILAPTERGRPIETHAKVMAAVLASWPKGLAPSAISALTGLRLDQVREALKYLQRLGLVAANGRTPMKEYRYVPTRHVPPRVEWLESLKRAARLAEAARGAPSLLTWI